MWRRGPGAGRPGGVVTGPDGITGSHQPPRVLPLDGTRNEAPGLPAKPQRLHRQPGACCSCEIAGGIADPHHSQRRSRVRRSATRRITAPVSTSRGLPLPGGDEAATRPASIHRAMVLGLSPVRRATAAGVWSAGGVRPHERQRSSPSQSAASRPEPQRQQALTGRPGRGPASSG